MTECRATPEALPSRTGRTTAGGPTILEFHPGTACSLACPFCHRKGRAYGGAAGAPIPLDRLTELLDEFAALGGRELYVSGGLEPFSRPEAAYTAIECGKRTGLHVRVYTNGTPAVLREASIRRMLLEDTDQVRFSVHAISERTFRLVQRPVSSSQTLNAVIDTVMGLIHERRVRGDARVGVSFLVLRENAHELVRAAEHWRDRGADFFDARADVAGDLSAAPVAGHAVRQLARLVDDAGLRPMEVQIGEYCLGKPCRFASHCYAPLEKLAVDPYGCVWVCALQASPGLRPAWARVGDLEAESFSTIVGRVKKRAADLHCCVCSPFEASYNRMSASPAP